MVDSRMALKDQAPSPNIATITAADATAASGAWRGVTGTTMRPGCELLATAGLSIPYLHKVAHPML